MEIVFKNENVIIEKEEQQGKTEIFVRALKGDLLATHSLAVQVNYLQEKNALLSETLHSYKTVTQPMATLEHTSEPDIRNYHFCAQHMSDGVVFDSIIEVKDFNPDGFRMEIKDKIIEAYWQTKKRKSKRQDWAIKSISRL